MAMSLLSRQLASRGPVPRLLRGAGAATAQSLQQRTAISRTGMVGSSTALRMQLRAYAASGADDDVRKLLNEAFEGNPAIFGEFSKTDNMDMATFQKLINMVIPSMGAQESKALFISMDTSVDQQIQSAEIFSDTTLAILRNRMNQTVGHPLEGSYHCLPRPPFHSDPKQLEAIEVLKVVFDEVLLAHEKPIPAVVQPPAPRPKAKAAPAAGGMFASLFGGGKKAQPVAAKPKVVAPPPPKPNAPKGAYLYGGCGCGKTVLLDLFFRSLPEGITARRLHWHEFIRDAFRSMQGHPAGENVFAAMADAMSKEFRVLLLDELLITHISEAILVKNLFRHMWARGMTVITTSNYKPEELYANGFNRDQFVEFIPELSAQSPVIDLGGTKDYRKVDLSDNSDIFWHPINQDTTTSFNKGFEEEVGGDFTSDFKLQIPMEKRHINVPSFGVDPRGAKVARFTFEDLCAKNMGRADYSTIAENYHTLFIEGVPKFKADLGAEFRRFVSLTDILYGKKVALRLQSEVHSEELFADGLASADLDVDEMWAFRRCSSMLSEMQNPKYHHMVWLMRNHMLQENALKL